MGRKEQIGIRIRTMRKSRRMTQEDLARAINQSASSITMYETGRRAPDYETLEALADVFNVPLASLVADDGPQYEPETSDDVRLLIRGLNKLTPEQVTQAKDMFRIMFMQTNPDLFEEGSDDK